MKKNKQKALDEYPMLFYPKLAKILGDKEVLLLSQIHYWLGVCGRKRDGSKWIYNTIKEWQEQFPCYSEKTIARKLQKLTKLGIVLTGRYNKRGYDKTKSYSIDYQRLSEITGKSFSFGSECEIQNRQNDHLIQDSLSTPIPETNTKTITKNTTETTNHNFLNKRPSSIRKAPRGESDGFGDESTALDEILKQLEMEGIDISRFEDN
jgi:hypothetical protein